MLAVRRRLLLSSTSCSAIRALQLHLRAVASSLLGHLPVPSDWSSVRKHSPAISYQAAWATADNSGHAQLLRMRAIPGPGTRAGAIFRHEGWRGLDRMSRLGDVGCMKVSMCMEWCQDETRKRLSRLGRLGSTRPVSRHPTSYPRQSAPRLRPSSLSLRPCTVHLRLPVCVCSPLISSPPILTKQCFLLLWTPSSTGTSRHC